MTVILYILAAIVLVVFVVPFLFELFGGDRLFVGSDGNKLFKKIKACLKGKAAHYKFKNDIEKLQDTNAQILWLKVIDEINSTDILGDKMDDNYYLDSLTEEDLQYPNRFDPHNFNHYPFALEIISGYKKVLMKNEYAFYKPDNILPYPKRLIYKSILFIIDFLDHENSMYEAVQKNKQKEHLAFIKSALYLIFIHDPKGYLPKKGMKNFRVGNELLEKSADNLEEKELLDWK